MKRTFFSLLYVLLGFAATCGAHAQQRMLTDFESLTGWEVVASDGVAVRLSHDTGTSGRALRIDFEFIAGSGYGGMRKKLDLDLPPNYQFSFQIKGALPHNNFEFKLADTTGDNVWWVNRRTFEFPADWQTIRVKKRHLSFAWGPRGGGEIERVGSVEFILAAGEGGKGSIWLDDFTFEPRSEMGYTGTPQARASSSLNAESGPEFILDTLLSTAWRSQAAPEEQWLEIDFQQSREFSGLVIDWEEGMHAREFSIRTSEDGKTWKEVSAVKKGLGEIAYIPLLEHEAQLVRINLIRSAQGKGYGIRSIVAKEVGEWNNGNDVYFSIAQEAPSGYYPRYFLRQQTYWTILGVSGDPSEALINEEGMIETDKLSFSLEPFLWIDGKLATWNDAKTSQQLQNDYLPIPSVRWRLKETELTITAFAAGETGKSVLYATYEVRNTSNRQLQGSLYLAIRPFQVLPPSQWLNITGGVANVKSIMRHDRAITINGNREVILLSKPDGFGAVEFAQGDITAFLRRNRLPSVDDVTDGNERASAAARYAFDLAPGARQRFFIAVPFHQHEAVSQRLRSVREAGTFVQAAQDETVKFWESKLNNVQITLPPSAQKLVNTVRSSLAYVLINRDGPAIQPGSRNYERAWIRDGSLTSSAMLRMGLTDEVREYINWYSPYQYPNGKVPCVVDRRGPDPVPEHDSHGQLIYAIAQYFRFTKDTTFLRDRWLNVVAAVNHIQSLRAERMTEQYKKGELRAYYGLVPESISHEGYSAKPMHSYWDNFFVLRGLKDAAYIASVLGEKEHAARYSALVDEFRNNFYTSIQLAMAANNIDYIPGCVELGDFDATSTAIGIYPGGELSFLPRAAVERTFERYYDYFEQRRQPATEWKDYTPYEIRVCGTFLHLGRNDRTHSMLDFFFKDQRPSGWNHWAEVVWRDPRHAAFIGDMPHTWVGSDFMTVVRTMFVFEREEDGTLVIGAGILESWVDSSVGVTVENLPTFYGMLSYSMKASGGKIVVRFEPGLLQGLRKIVVVSPRSQPIQKVLVDGKRSKNHDPGTVTLERVPREIKLEY